VRGPIQDGDTPPPKRGWPWGGLALGTVTVLTAAIGVVGFVAVGPAHGVERDLYVASVVILAVAVVLLLWGGAQREGAVAWLWEEAMAIFDEVKVADRPEESPRGFRDIIERRRARGGEPPWRELSDEEMVEGGREWLRTRGQAALATAKALDGVGAHREAAEVAGRAERTLDVSARASSSTKSGRWASVAEGVLPSRRARRARKKVEAHEATWQEASQASEPPTPPPPPEAQGLWRRARTKLAAGSTALILALGTGVGTTVGADGAGAFHDGGPPIVRVEQARLEAQTCTQAVEQVAALTKTDPSIARLYAEHTKGLPDLVDPEVQERCGGDFDALLRK
jgi:hypothetical protein